MSREFESVNRIAHKLPMLQWVSRTKAIFRCPLCGDSKKDPNIKRGGIYELGGVWLFSCFNCKPNATSYTKFLSEFDREEFNYFRIGRIREESSLNMKTTTKKEEVVEQEKLSVLDMSDRSLFRMLPRVDELNRDHEARVYLRDRRAPTSSFTRMYYVDDFPAWNEATNPRLILDGKHGQSGIVFPLIDREGNEFGYQCRFLKGKFRYMTTMIDTAQEKVFGMDTIDVEKDINVFEGVFDSFLVKNSIAALDASLHGTARRLVNKYDIDPERFVLWFDFEPNNKNIVKLKNDAIDQGFRVAFAPKFYVTHKDLSDCVKYSSNPHKTLNDIVSNTISLSGLRARLEMSGISGTTI